MCVSLLSTADRCVQCGVSDLSVSCSPTRWHVHDDALTPQLFAWGGCLRVMFSLTWYTGSPVTG